MPTLSCYGLVGITILQGIQLPRPYYPTRNTITTYTAPMNWACSNTANIFRNSRYVHKRLLRDNTVQTMRCRRRQMVRGFALIVRAFSSKSSTLIRNSHSSILISWSKFSLSHKPRSHSPHTHWTYTTHINGESIIFRDGSNTC